MDKDKAKLSTIIERAEEATGTLSEICRKLCFSAIAVVWILRESTADHVISGGMRKVLILVSLSLVVDLFQYLFKATAWFVLSRTSGAKHNDQLVEYRSWIEPTTYFIWFAKVALCAVAYAYLLNELYSVLGF